MQRRLQFYRDGKAWPADWVRLCFRGGRFFASIMRLGFPLERRHPRWPSLLMLLSVPLRVSCTVIQTILHPSVEEDEALFEAGATRRFDLRCSSLATSHKRSLW